MAGSRILVVDDEKGLRDLFYKKLVEEGYTVETAQEGKEALRKARMTPFDLVLMDIRLPKMEGLEVIVRMKRILPDCAFIILTGLPLGEEMMGLLKERVFDCILKPFDLSKIVRKIRKALEAKPASAGHD